MKTTFLALGLVSIISSATASELIPLSVKEARLANGKTVSISTEAVLALAKRGYAVNLDINFLNAGLEQKIVYDLEAKVVKTSDNGCVVKLGDVRGEIVYRPGDYAFSDVEKCEMALTEASLKLPKAKEIRLTKIKIEEAPGVKLNPRVVLELAKRGYAADLGINLRNKVMKVKEAYDLSVSVEKVTDNSCEISLGDESGVFTFRPGDLALTDSQKCEFALEDAVKKL